MNTKCPMCGKDNHDCLANRTLSMEDDSLDEGCWQICTCVLCGKQTCERFAREDEWVPSFWDYALKKEQGPACLDCFHEHLIFNLSDQNYYLAEK